MTRRARVNGKIELKTLEVLKMIFQYLKERKRSERAISEKERERENSFKNNGAYECTECTESD